MIIKARIMQNDKLLGYITDDNEFIDIKDVYRYTPDNVILLNDGTWQAKKGYLIETIYKDDAAMIIENRNTRIVGKPNLLHNYTFAKLSATQKKILEEINKLGKDKLLVIDKKQVNIKINMLDLSALTARTGVEFSLFERPDKYIVVMGTSHGIYLGDDEVAFLSNGKYKWIGHTHPGSGFNCLIPSDSDFETLNRLNQKKSVIFNSVGEYYIFGEENEI